MEGSIDRARAEYLVETYSDLILRLSYTYLNSTHDAKDICQTVLLRLLTDGRAFTDAEHEKAFIIRTTANACKDLLKSAWRRRTCALEEVLDTPAPPPPEEDAMLAAVQALPSNYREAIYLHYYEGYGVQEIAAMLGRNPATISTHLNRGRHRLKNMLGGLGYEQTV